MMPKSKADNAFHQVYQTNFTSPVLAVCPLNAALLAGCEDGSLQTVEFKDEVMLIVTSFPNDILSEYYSDETDDLTSELEGVASDKLSRFLLSNNCTSWFGHSGCLLGNHTRGPWPQFELARSFSLFIFFPFSQYFYYMDLVGS